MPRPHTGPTRRCKYLTAGLVRVTAGRRHYNRGRRPHLPFSSGWLQLCHRVSGRSGAKPV